MASCLERGHLLSKYGLLKLFQLRKVLLWWVTQQITRGLGIKSLGNMFSHLTLMSEEVGGIVPNQH